MISILVCIVGDMNLTGAGSPVNKEYGCNSIICYGLRGDIPKHGVGFRNISDIGYIGVYFTKIVSSILLIVGVCPSRSGYTALRFPLY